MSAKSPTPIPAPPVKIQRGAPTATPVRPRKKKRRNPLIWFLQGLVRRLYFGLKTGIKFLFLVPILVFMVAFSYNVDRSGLFQGALAPRRIHASSVRRIVWRFRSDACSISARSAFRSKNPS